MPGIVRWTGHVPAGRVTHEIASTMDLFMTIAGLVGAKLPDVKLDGTDIAPLLLGEANSRGRETFWYYSGDELQAVRQGDWKLHLPHEYLEVAGAPGRGGKPSNFDQIKPAAIEVSGIRGIASRHGYRVESMGLTLYNLKDDPGERTDVAGKHPEVVKRLQAVAAEARADLGDSLTKVSGKNVRPPGKKG
jgi:arylsulfatase